MYAIRSYYEPAHRFDDNDYRLAAAALLVHAAGIDGVLGLLDKRQVGYDKAKAIYSTETLPALNSVQTILNNGMEIISKNT